ncbi:MAG: S24 family peptidase, partial [Gammaproteobacteria bacterium]|nr:S24 family peptidase [Gammaproteobacteria bacterium]
MGRRKKETGQLDPVRRRLLGMVADSDTNLRTASLAIERNAAYLHQFVHRGTPKVLAEDDREALAEHLGCSPDLLKHGRGFGRRARPNPKPGPARPSPYAAPRGYSAVPEIDVRASAGRGAWNEEFEQTSDMWIFADPLIRHEFRAKPEDLQMITVDGDSMAPVLSSGDRVLIDVSRKVPVPPGIFVIWDGMGLVAKRIEHVPHSDPPRVVLK